MENLILENKNLIYSITRYFERYSNKDDLFQAGCIGMIMAYKNYNKDMNVKFTTYAYPYIIGEMKKLIMEDKSMKISRNLQLLNLKIEKTICLLTQKLMREPTISELASYLEIPEHDISEAMNSIKPIYSIDQPINSNGKDITLQDTVGENDNMNIDDLIILKQELQNLNSFERELIDKRYIKDLTQQQAAKELGISQVQVSRNEQKVLTKLRSKLAS